MIFEAKAYGPHSARRVTVYREGNFLLDVPFHEAEKLSQDLTINENVRDTLALAIEAED